MVSGNEMRVGDAEREATAAELREHYASGRLTLEELNERLDKAFAAKTRGDLDGLMLDLPSARAGAGAGPQAGRPGWSSGPGGPGAGWGGPGRGSSGPGSSWTGPGTSWSGPGGANWGANAGRGACGGVGSMVASCVLICALFAVGILGVADIGAGRPIGIVLLLAAFALLRRLVFRRRIRARGPRRRRW